MTEPTTALSPRNILTIVFCGLFGAGLFLCWVLAMPEEDLFLAVPIVRFIQVTLIILAMLAAYRIGRTLSPCPSRYARVSSNATAPLLTLIFGCLFSHGLMWGGLWHLSPGHPGTLQATVSASGLRHGKASHGHGAWIDLRLADQSRKTHLETQELFSFYSDSSASRNYSCSLKTARPFDVVRLVGRTSSLGFAVDRIVPVNERLIDACTKASGDPP